MGALLLLLQCKQMGESGLYSVQTGDDALKVAVNYIGNKKCEEYYTQNPSKAETVIDKNNTVGRITTHMLAGKNGELISEEFKAVKQNEGRADADSLQFSGDKLFKKTKDYELSIEEIEENCRVLALSVDSDAKPHIVFADGGVRTKQKDVFTRINLPEFGSLDCDNNVPFCTFSNIKRSNRYFVLVVPDKASKQMKAKVTWKKNGEEKTHEITITNLSCGENLCPPQPAPSLSPEPVAELPIWTLPGEFTAADLRGGGGKGIRPAKRDVFAKLEVLPPTLIAGTKNAAEITLQLTATRNMGDGKVRFSVYGTGRLDCFHASGLSYHHVSSLPANTKEYKFMNMNENTTVSVTCKVDLMPVAMLGMPIKTTPGSYKVSFKAKIIRDGFLSSWKDFQKDDQGGNSNMMVKLNWIKGGS